jgi:hypothetical protein
MVRATVPLPEDLGDVSFDAPSGAWSAQLSRLTVNLFLHEVGRSAQPPHPRADRRGPDGAMQRRPPLPMVELSYLVSAWAGNSRDEHQLLGDVLTCFLANQVLPPEFLPEPLSSGVQIVIGQQGTQRPRELWQAVGGTLKPSFNLSVTVASDAYQWTEAAPQVERIEAISRRVAPPSSTRPTRPPGPDARRSDRPTAKLRTRREADRLVGEPDPAAE